MLLLVNQRRSLCRGIIRWFHASGHPGELTPQSLSSCPSSVTSMSPGKAQTLWACKEHENPPSTGAGNEGLELCWFWLVHFSPLRAPIWPVKLLALTHCDFQSLFVLCMQREKEAHSGFRGETGMVAESGAKGKTQQAKEAQPDHCIVPKLCPRIRALLCPSHTYQS